MYIHVPYCFAYYIILLLYYTVLCIHYTTLYYRLHYAIQCKNAMPYYTPYHAILHSTALYLHHMPYYRLCSRWTLDILFYYTMRY